MELFDLGPYIRQHRIRQGLSITELASRAGLDRSLLSRLENQRLPEIGYAKLSRVLANLDLELRPVKASPLPTLDDLLNAHEGAP